MHRLSCKLLGVLAIRLGKLAVWLARFGTRCHKVAELIADASVKVSERALWHAEENLRKAVR